MQAHCDQILRLHKRNWVASVLSEIAQFLNVDQKFLKTLSGSKRIHLDQIQVLEVASSIDSEKV